LTEAAAEPTRVAIVDDHPVLREGTAALLARQPGLSIVGVAGTVEEAETRPAIVVLTSYDYPQYADAAMRLGAAGFVLKTAPITELIDAIRLAASGGMAFGRRPVGAVRLSERELDVVRLVVDGRSNDEIGARLGIGAKTVESHLRRLFERLDVASRTELATRALREGWLDVPPGA